MVITPWVPCRSHRRRTAANGTAVGQGRLEPVANDCQQSRCGHLMQQCQPNRPSVFVPARSPSSKGMLAAAFASSCNIMHIIGLNKSMQHAQQATCYNGQDTTESVTTGAAAAAGTSLLTAGQPPQWRKCLCNLSLPTNQQGANQETDSITTSGCSSSCSLVTGKAVSPAGASGGCTDLNP